MNELITVCITNYNTSKFIEVSLLALNKLTKNPYKVLINDNGSKSRDIRKLRRLADNYDNVFLIFRKTDKPASIAHGEALNILIDKIDTPYGVMLDSDAIFLKKNWDEILINQLDYQVKIIGAPVAEGAINKPKDFPFQFAVLFETKIFKSLDIDMRPKSIKEAIEPGLDTAWEMREKYLENGYKGKVFICKNTRYYKDGPFGNLICTEYYLEGYQGIFACHFGRGHSLGAGKYKKLPKILMLPYIRQISRRLKGYRERKVWLNLCKDIIKE